METRKPRVLLYDLETSPLLIWAYGTYDTNAIKIERQSHIFCFSYKWLDEGKVRCVSQFDFPARFKNDPYDDYDVVKTLHELISQADITIGYNVIGFDNKVSNTRFLYHGLDTPPPNKAVDPLRTARSKFKFPNNKLTTVSEYLGLGTKTEHTNGDLWYPCIQGDKKAWKLMAKYCDNDVVLLEDVYKKLLPYMTNHPNIAMLSGDVDSCPRCGGHRIVGNGWRTTNSSRYQRFKCGNCGASLSDRTHAKLEYERSTYVNYT